MKKKRRKTGKQRRWGGGIERGGGDRTRQQSMEGTRDQRLCSCYYMGVAMEILQPEMDCKSRPADDDEAGG